MYVYTYMFTYIYIYIHIYVYINTGSVDSAETGTASVAYGAGVSSACFTNSKASNADACCSPASLVGSDETHSSKSSSQRLRNK